MKLFLEIELITISISNYNMINICTVSDINYLAQGLTLYRSLNNKNVALHYLCIDKMSYDILSKIEDQNIIPYSVSELTNNDEHLNHLKNGDYKYFCWSLASYFSNYLLSSDKFESITYIDSDIYFHHNIQELYDTISNRDVSIFRHRQFDMSYNGDEGRFNVGVVYFRNSVKGKEVLGWWSDAVLHKKYPELATCGDQKYLNNFLDLCSDDEISVDEVGHGAPWMWQLYDYTKYLSEGKVIWGSQEQLLLFSHFSQFKLNGSGYIPSVMHHVFTPMHHYTTNEPLKSIYDNYHNEVNETIKYYNL